ncbi:glycosyltransferase family 39 protein [uncultured Sphaerotilus sp.]|uniref:ArnT family glycosyltransferase n=1 Tax=uncultured Sphaerotilus sp. TaxID=474984 RepID=UPI0030CA53C8
MMTTDTLPPTASASGPADASPASTALTHHPGWTLGLLALWLLLTIGLRPLLLPDEGRYSEVAREMLRGDGLVPTLLGLPFFHKPPLMYWLDIAGMHLLGVHAFAARVAPALGAWLMGAALFLDLRRRVGPREALIALGVMATTPFFFIGGQYANHDMLVAGLITVAIVCGQRAVDDPARTDLRWLLAAWGAMALGVLAKGLIGVVLPVLVVGPWLLAQRRWRQCLGLMHPLAVGLFLLIAAPWFVAMQLRYPGFFDYFFMEQHFRRFAQVGFNNAQPAWFYVAVLPLLTLPWSLWLPAAWRTPPQGLQRGLVLWWLVAITGFFSMPTSKLVGYVLPAVPPLCMLLGLAVARGSAWRKVLPAAAVLCVGIVAALAWKAPHSHRDLGEALARQHQPQDRVVFVDGAFFDVPFYAGLTQPPIVLSNWNDPDLPKTDNWRKELFDAGRFDPPAAARQLWRTDRAAELLCAPGTIWFIADRAWKPMPALSGPAEVYKGKNGVLWRAVVDTPPPGCP